MKPWLENHHHTHFTKNLKGGNKENGMENKKEETRS